MLYYKEKNIRKTTRTFMAINQQSLSLHCLPIPAFGLNRFFIKYIKKYADKGFAPLFFGHEPNMLLLH